jgi:hypothetical protein
MRGVRPDPQNGSDSYPGQPDRRASLRGFAGGPGMVIGNEESMVENLEIPSTRPVRLCADLSSVGSSQPGLPIEGANPERGVFFSFQEQEHLVHWSIIVTRPLSFFLP